MMINNLITRIMTSIGLFIFFIIFFFSHNHAWFFLIILGSSIVFLEFIGLVNKIGIKKTIYTNMIFLFTFFYLCFLTYCLIKLSDSKLNTVFILSICIFSDVGGYVVGKLIGGKKLTKISPKKTVSGSIGSFVFSYIPLFIIYMCKLDFINSDIFRLMLYTFLISLTCQTGDIIISFFKRKAKVKDTGKLLPGHGGLLDRVDGLIFAVPVAFIFSKLNF